MTMLRHTKTGDLYQFNPDLARHDDIELVEDPGATPAPPVAKRKPKIAKTGLVNPDGDDFLGELISDAN